MHVLKAHVRKGRIELDEPADLAEGTAVKVLVEADDELSPEDLAAIEEGIADIQAGRVFDRSVIHEDFRARRQNRVLGEG